MTIHIHAKNLIRNADARKMGLTPWDNLESESTYYPMLVLINEESHDCDGTHSSNLTAIPATQEHVNAYVNAFHDSLEGPGIIQLVTNEWASQYLEDREVERGMCRY